ncbi:MAG: DUF1559 domain-containing protein [Lentisphaeraceae bacterium]|nr:DUF1559 domain-containing protein [Lentisphaeraceae bacterium]
MKNKRFTLIELLVAIAIIGILLSLLLPSLKNARQAAMVAVCTSNQKQIGVGIFAYSSSNNGAWLYSPQVGVNSLGNSLPAGSKLPAEVMWSEVGESIDLFTCPIDPAPQNFSFWSFSTRQYFKGEDAVHSYMFNEWAAWLKARFKREIFRLTELDDPSKWPQVTDGAFAVSSQTWDRCDPLRVGNYGVMDWWHPNEKVNMLLGDGHVENKNAYVISSFDPH